MAIATQVTISTGNKVTFNYQSREVGVELTYQLEREDTDVLAVVREKAAEVAQAHQTVWQTMRDEKAAQKKNARSNGRGHAQGHKATKRPEENDEGSIESASEEDGSEEPSSESQRKAITALFNASTLTDDEFETMLKERFGWSTVEELSYQQASTLLVELQRRERERLMQARSERNGHL